MACLDSLYFDLYIKVERGIIPSPDEYFGTLMGYGLNTKDNNPLFNYLDARKDECKKIDLCSLIPRDQLTPGKYEGTMRGNDPLVTDALRTFWDSMRDRAAQIWAFAVPNREAAEAIKKYQGGGVIEIGAGTGYWAKHLQDNGVNITPYDICPPG